MPAVAMGVFAFLMVAYSSAYTPPKPQIQRIVCVEFKKGTSDLTVQKHLEDFQDLKRNLPEIAGYSAGKTFETNDENTEFQVVHYLTFRSDADVEAFRNSEAYKNFLKVHENTWEKVLVVNASIK